MRPMPFPRILLSLTVAATLAFVVACSGSSASMTPTAPTSVAASAAGGGTFGANSCEIDPTDPSCTPPPPPCPASIGTNTTDPEPEPDPCEPPTLLSGRFTGGGFQIDELGLKVTRGFTVHCDNVLTNNLEINWDGGNNFHIEKESLTSVVCTKPQIPNPPDADVSRIEASSPGTCNGGPATIDFILEDWGEPGRNDRAQLIISGSCTLNLSLRTIDGGNIQAHFDQPHKQ